MATPVVWLAFLVPGYLLVRPHVTARHAALLSVPFAIALLYQAVVALQLLQLPITGLSVGALVLLAIGASWAIRRPSVRDDVRQLRPGPFSIEDTVAIAVALFVLAAVTFEVFREPLLHKDNVYRWRFLAEQLLATHNLNYYPPVSAEDFKTYFYVDAIPPSLSVAYWWCFTLTGAAPVHGLGFIQLQALFILALMVALTRNLSPATPRWVPLLLGASTLHIASALSSAAEAGLLMIGTLGVLWAVTDDELTPTARAVVVAVFASVAANAREYGLVVTALAAFALLLRRAPARSVAAGAALAVALIAPWYVRSWLRTGNPFYVIPLGPLFSDIPSYTRYLRRVGEARGITHLPRDQQARLAFWLFYGAPAVWVVGAWAAVRARARPLFAWLFVATWLAVYWKATSQTSGGYGFAFRVVTPALVVLAALCGPFVPVKRWALVLLALLGVKSGFDVAFGAGGRFFKVPPSQWIEAPAHALTVSEQSVFELRAKAGAAPRVLTSNAFLFVALKRHGVECVPIWSPEVSYLLDDELPVDAVGARLAASGINAYARVDWLDFVADERARQLHAFFDRWPVATVDAEAGELRAMASAR